MSHLLCIVDFCSRDLNFDFVGGLSVSELEYCFCTIEPFDVVEVS